MEAMAKGQDAFDVVGFGGGDSVEAGEKFVAEHGLSFRNFYDEGRADWGKFGVAKQPAWVLYDASGAELGRGSGAVTQAQVDELLSGAS